MPALLLRNPEVEFLDVIGTKASRVFLLAIHSPQPYMHVTTEIKGTTLFAVVGLKRKINVKFLLASLKTLSNELF